MWRVAVLAPLLVAGSSGSPQGQNNNVTYGSPPSLNAQLDSFNAQAGPSPIYITLSDTAAASFSIQSQASSSSSSPGLSASIPRGTSNIVPSLLSSSQASPSPVLLITTTWTVQVSSTQSLSSSLSGASSKVNSSRFIWPSSKGLDNASTAGLCTGCVIQAYNPITTFFNAKELANYWTATTVTATLITEFTTYQDAVVTNVKTMNETSTLIDPRDLTITHTTPTFTVDLVSGTKITLDAGPTYVIYDDLYGGLDESASKFLPAFGFTSECKAKPTSLVNWRPTRTEDWQYFITSYTTTPSLDTMMNAPAPLPSTLLRYLQKNLAIRFQYRGSDIATCTLQPIPGIFYTQTPHSYGSTKTFLSITYETTSTHSTVVGCLRIGCGAPEPTPTSHSNVINDGNPTPKEPDNFNAQSMPSDNSPSKPDDGQDGSDTSEQRPPGNVVTIGNFTYTVRPRQSTSNPSSQNEQNRPPSVVIIGDQTLTRGQSTDINGVPVLVPTGGGGTRIIVGGTTVPVNNKPTAAPILTAGSNTVTADAQGQFIVGTETLKLGGPAVTVGGSTLSLGPGGTIAIVNGVTQSVANVPLITAPPVLTVGGRTISATTIGGTTQLVLGSQTLSPGGPPVTISSTTYSLASTGSAIVINGITSTLSPNQPINNPQITPTIRNATPAFIFSPSHTLTPGGAITLSSTTFSMPASNKIIVNGQTTTLPSPITPAPNLPINGFTLSPTFRSGTTEFVFAPGTTLRPGEALVLGRTTYSLDRAGAALVVDGHTSWIPIGLVGNNASATRATRAKHLGDFVWGGIGGGAGGGESTSKGGGVSGRQAGWVEGWVVVIAGWVCLLI